VSNAAKRRRALAWHRYEKRIEVLTGDWRHEPSPGYLRAINAWYDRHRHYPHMSRRALVLLERLPEFLQQFGALAAKMGRAITDRFGEFATNLSDLLTQMVRVYEQNLRAALLARLARGLRELENRGGTHALVTAA
jgi:hypothetical protein